MNQQPTTGNNSTTRERNPQLYHDMERGHAEFGPTSSGDAASLIASLRAGYAKESSGIGHVPSPAGRELPAEMIDLMDKLGERLVFERAGTRLYDGLIAKYDAYGGFAGGPTRDELQHIRSEELEHFLMLEQAIRKLGGDPAAVTPGADAAATLGRGVLDIVTDARTNLLQSLEAALVAELADNASWEMLEKLAQRAGADELLEPFRSAQRSERQHLQQVQSWIKGGHELA